MPIHATPEAKASRGYRARSAATSWGIASDVATCDTARLYAHGSPGILFAAGLGQTINSPRSTRLPGGRSRPGDVQSLGRANSLAACAFASGTTRVQRG